MTEDERTYVPESEFPKVFFRARIYLLVYAVVIALSVWLGSILPLLFVGLANIFGSWLMVVYGLTQHAGLAENVLDHRLNCRTVFMNPIHRYLYWNMNYHVEHHMFPLVPYHALPKLHEAVKDDCPTPYPSLLAAWREIIPAVLRQTKDPAWHVKRKLPEPAARLQEGLHTSDVKPDAEGGTLKCKLNLQGPKACQVSGATNTMPSSWPQNCNAYITLSTVYQQSRAAGLLLDVMALEIGPQKEESPLNPFNR
jgi:hypothetical protein